MSLNIYTIKSIPTKHPKRKLIFAWSGSAKLLKKILALKVGKINKRVKNYERS